MVVQQEGGTFTTPAGYTVQSFSDATGAPGILECIPAGITVNAGAILTASTTTLITIDPSVTIQNVAPAESNNGDITYQWRRTGGSSATLTGDAATYTLNSDPSNYAATGVYYINRYAKDATCGFPWVAAAGTYTLSVIRDQQQDGCTFTPPPVAGTFADFPNAYSASTYVTLIDERDGKNYTVVKIANRWIMAQNLNYQKDLTWQADAKQPSTVTGHNPALIGHFWCPGGYSSTATSSTRESCEVWGGIVSVGDSHVV
jgi:hypothetical protein